MNIISFLDYFEPGKKTIQKLSQTAIAVSSFDCQVAAIKKLARDFMNENDSLPVFPHFQFGFFFSQQSVAPIENGKEDGKRQARCMDEPCLRF